MLIYLYVYDCLYNIIKWKLETCNMHFYVLYILKDDPIKYFKLYKNVDRVKA